MKKQNPLFRTPERLEQAKQLLIQTSTREFIKQGYDGTSMHDLARAFGLSKSGMYHYIGSKEEILENILDYAIKGVPIQKVKDTAKGANPVQALIKSIKTYLKHVDENREYYVFLNHIMIRLTKEQRKNLLRMSFIDFMTELIQKGIERGDFRTNNPNFVSSLIVTLAHGWATRQWQWRHSLTLNEYIEEVTESILTLLHYKASSVSQKEKRK